MVMWRTRERWSDGRAAMRARMLLNLHSALPRCCRDARDAANDQGKDGQPFCPGEEKAHIGTGTIGTCGLTKLEVEARVRSTRPRRKSIVPLGLTKTMLFKNVIQAKRIKATKSQNLLSKSMSETRITKALKKAKRRATRALKLAKMMTKIP